MEQAVFAEEVGSFGQRNFRSVAVAAVSRPRRRGVGTAEVVESGGLRVESRSTEPRMNAKGHATNGARLSPATARSWSATRATPKPLAAPVSHMQDVDGVLCDGEQNAISADAFAVNPLLNFHVEGLAFLGQRAFGSGHGAPLM